MLGGVYEPALDQIDAGRLIEKNGGRWLCDSVTAIRAEESQIQLASGETLSYDVLSLNVGSVGVPLPGSHEQVVEIKPLSNLAGLRRAIEAGTQPLRLVVVGAGPSGCELAANLRGLLVRARSARRSNPPVLRRGNPRACHARRSGKTAHHPPLAGRANPDERPRGESGRQGPRAD